MSLTHQFLSSPHKIAEDNDASGLFSRFGAFGDTARYRELIREDAALAASLRWPLLAELLGADRAESDAK